VRVGAIGTKTWTSPDSNGKSWQFEDHWDEVEDGSVGAGQRFVASTDAYPETTYKFYEATEDAINATVEKIAKSQALSSSAVDEWSVSVEEEEGAVVSESELVETMSLEGISEDAAFETMVKKKAASASPPKAPPTASGGAALKAIQASLIKLGYDLGSYGADGKIGPFTRGAITKFKKDHGLKPADSTVNEAFRKALDAAVSGKVAPPVAGVGGLGTTGLLLALGAAVVAIGLFFILKK